MIGIYLVNLQKAIENGQLELNFPFSIVILHTVQCEAPGHEIAKLGLTELQFHYGLWYLLLITIVTGAFVNQQI